MFVYALSCLVEIRSLSLSSFLSSESRNQTVPELVEGPSLGYAEPQKKYSRARIDGDAVIRLVV